MPKILLLSVLLLFAVITVNGQEKVIVQGDSLKRVPKPDTAAYVNLGRIAGRKAALRSAMVPGWGQVGNGLTVYRGLKVAAIYTGGTLLALSFIQNNKKYHQYLFEVQQRELNGDQPVQGNGLEQYTNTAGLITAKDVFRRNKEVIIFSFIGLYAVNIIEAYVDARLKYFDIGNESLGVKLSPAMINTNTIYGYHYTPGLKLSFRL